MKVLVLGGTGATGKLVISQLLENNIEVIAIVRSKDKLSEEILKNNLLTVIVDSITDIDEFKAQEYVLHCDGIISCLGHSLNFKGIYGKPKQLVTDTVKLFCTTIINMKGIPVKFILMNTTGNRNRDLNEKISFGEKLVMGLVRLLLPPQRDNENAAEYLRSVIGHENRHLQWVTVRPDGLINKDLVTDYELYNSPTRSAIFNAGVTSRINVANFMMRLIKEDNLWLEWKGQMPVIYNKIDN